MNPIPTLQSVLDYLNDRVDYDLQGDPPGFVGNEEARLAMEVEGVIRELGKRKEETVMPNDNAPELKPPAGYVLVTDGNFQSGDYIYVLTDLEDEHNWRQIPESMAGKPIITFAARPPTPKPSERERELVEALREIIQKAPEKGPLWFGSEEMKAARKALEREGEETK